MKSPRPLRWRLCHSLAGFAAFSPGVALLLSLTSVSAAETRPGKPNIVFILADDLGYGDLGVFGQNARRTAGDPKEPWHFTPQLDRMAREGIQLRHHYCPAPVCAPSRASLLLGVNQGHANVRDNQFDKALENNHTLATVAKEAGYATAAIGKWGLQGGGHNPTEWPAYPTKRGFDYYFGYVRHNDGHEHYPKEGIYRGAKECYEGAINITPALDQCYTTDLFTARAKKWIMDQHAANQGQPFFLYLAFDTPHAVLELPTQAYPAGGGARGGVQWSGIPGRMINTANGTVDSYVHPDYASATWDDGKNSSAPWPDVYKRYATSVRRIDDCVGDLIQLLKDLGLDHNTIVVFSSDNGPTQESYLATALRPDFFNSFGPFDGIKRDLWEGGVRVPTIARWPGRIPAERVDSTPSGLWDWMATFAEIAGVPAPARSDGVSLLPALTGTSVQAPSNVYIEYFVKGATPDYAEFAPAHRGRTRNQMQAVRIGDYLGVRYDITSAADDFEIYDVAVDPKQVVNLARQSEQTGESAGAGISRSVRFAALQQQMKDRVLQSRMPDRSAPRPYDHALVPPAQESPVVPGIEWRSFAQSFPWVPELAAMTPTTRGVTELPALEVRPSDKDFGLLFIGYLKVPADGDYTFYLSADTRALLRLHAAAVLDADFGYGFTQPTELSARLPLQAGLHPVRLYYASGTSGTPRLNLSWSGPGIDKQPIPASAYFHSAEPARAGAARE